METSIEDSCLLCEHRSGQEFNHACCCQRGTHVNAPCMRRNVFHMLLCDSLLVGLLLRFWTQVSLVCLCASGVCPTANGSFLVWPLLETLEKCSQHGSARPMASRAHGPKTGLSSYASDPANSRATTRAKEYQSGPMGPLATKRCAARARRPHPDGEQG